MKTFIVLGVVLKLSILGCLVLREGPIKVLIFIWGTLFIFSAATGLLSFVISETVEPIQAYLDKLIFLVTGIVLVFITSRYISYESKQEN